MIFLSIDFYTRYFVLSYSIDVVSTFLIISYVNVLCESVQLYIYGLVQDCSNSIVYALESLQSCTKQSKCSLSLFTPPFIPLRPSGAYMRLHARPSLLQIMACYLFDTESLSELVLAYCNHKILIDSETANQAYIPSTPLTCAAISI